MSTRPGSVVRQTGWAGGLVAATVIALAGCSGGAPAPSASDTPQVVVQEFIAALDGHDADRALALLTPLQRERVANAADSWLTNVEGLRDVSIGMPRDESGTSLASATRYRFVVRVPVDFTLQQKREVSMVNGRTVWGYVLVRNAQTDPWLIDDQGVD